ncbi:MAG TPA: biotin/lipoyl-binding protein [Tepidisphaeraceae bacterium]|jgi:putative peptide zinc metalloprotease protein
MLQLRPTFSESWYRVANLKVRLRASAQISRQFYRGERWYVVRDPAGNQYHRLSDPAYRFVALLDGTRTVAEAWDICGGHLADDAPTQPEVIQILSQLNTANLIEADITPDASVLLRRHKQLVKQEWQQRLMNVLFPRIPLWDPDKFLKRWMPVMEKILSQIGAIVWLVVVGYAVTLILPHIHDLKTAAENSLAPGNWVYLWLMFVLIKFIHELGHAFACRRFGGECHEMGIMFLVFIPTPYVDASSAWAFPSRWHRMFVGMAGMVFELFVASLLAFIWVNTNAHSSLMGIPINQLAFNGMLVASVTTVIFNGNPLLRYDGYYILADFLEIPNLQFRSSEYCLGLIKRHVFRIKDRQPLPPVGQRIWLFIYGILSSIYRVFVGIVIILVVTWQVPVLGILMALAGVATWLIVPVVKLGRYLALDPELHRKRTGATAFTIGVAVAVVVVVGMIPFWVHYQGEGITEAMQRDVLHAETPGFVQSVNVKDGDYVKKGQVLLVCRADELDSAIEQTRAELRHWELMETQGRVQDPSRGNSSEAAVDALQKQLAEELRRQRTLTVRAPFDGIVVAPNFRDLKGKFVQRGEELGMVAQTDKLLVRLVLDQDDAELMKLPTYPETQIRLVGDVGDVLKSKDVRVIPAAQPNLPHPSLSYLGGGAVQTEPQDPTKPMVRQFEIWVTFNNKSSENGLKYYPGQKAYVRFWLNQKHPLFWQWSRSLMQLIEAKQQNSKWL